MTLVEILVAMTILLVVSAATTLIFRSISNAWRTGQIRTERYQQARLLIDLFSREVSSVLVSSKSALIGSALGDASRLHPEGAGDELFFAAAIPGRGAVVERGYWLNNKGEVICHDDDSGDGDYSTGSAETCAQEVQRLTIHYFDGNEWLPRWNSAEGQAQAGFWPKAIRFSIAIGRQKPEDFETVIHVPTS